MKLLFDEHLPPRLAKLSAPYFLGSAHSLLIGLGRMLDTTLWVYAKENGFTVVSKDRDLYKLSVERGCPPKVVWLRIGNASAGEIWTRFLACIPKIQEFGQDADECVLILLAADDAEEV